MKKNEFWLILKKEEAGQSGNFPGSQLPAAAIVELQDDMAFLWPKDPAFDAADARASQDPLYSRDGAWLSADGPYYGFEDFRKMKQLSEAYFQCLPLGWFESIAHARDNLQQLTIMLSKA